MSGVRPPGGSPAELSRRALSPAQREILAAVADAAGDTGSVALVGGAVRDALLGREAGASVDLDVAVPSGAVTLGQRVADGLGGRLVVLDAERGAARVVARGHRLDLTDYRAPTLEEDLRRRDFSANALAVDLRRLLGRGRAPVIDPAGGVADLQARRLRLPGPGVLEEDPLRALRGVRFETQLGLRLTPAAARAVRAAAPGLAAVAGERVRDELMVVLGLPGAARGLRRADHLGLLPVVLPEVEPMRATPQPHPHRFDVLEHSLRAVAACDRLLSWLGALRPFDADLAGHLEEELAGGIDRRRALRLAALLHDVSKPETREVIEGQVRFFGHDVRGAERARAIGERWRLPDRVIAVVALLVRHHLRPMHLAAAGEVTARARYRFFRDLGDEARALLLLTLADAAAVRGESPFAVWRRAPLLHDLFRGWQVQEKAAAVPPLVRGGDVMAHFGLAPGPAVGRLLRRAREAQDLGLVGSRAEALTYLDSASDRDLE